MMKISVKLFIFLVGLLPSNSMGITLKDGSKCADTEVACADDSKCVDVSQLCDYEKNCPDSSDEFNMMFCKNLSTLRKECSRGQVQCTQTSSMYSYLSNECMDVVTACKLGNRCLKDTEVCEGIKVGKLLPSDHTQAKDNEFENLMKFIAKSLNQTLQLNVSSCPPFYSLYKDKCILVFTPIQVSWAEAKLFCASTLGSLIVLDELEKFKEILDHLKENGIESKFWIGGYANETLHDVWMWIDENTVQMGPFFWAITIDTWQVKIPQTTTTTTTSYGYYDHRHRTKSHSPSGYETECHYEKQLLPQKEATKGRCLAILNENSYYFSNENCTKKMSPICIAEKILDVESYEG